MITGDRISKLEIPTLYFLLFVTTEMLKHLNTEKKSWMTSSLASQFSFFFFICLAITTDDIARHWESSSTAWETAMTNQVMRHGVIHLRVTPTVLPLWCTRTDARTQTRTQTRSHTDTRMHTHKQPHWKLKKHCELRRRSKERDQGWQEHKADESNEISFWDASAGWTTTVIYS